MSNVRINAYEAREQEARKIGEFFGQMSGDRHSVAMMAARYTSMTIQQRLEAELLDDLLFWARSLAIGGVYTASAAQELSPFQMFSGASWWIDSGVYHYAKCSSRH